MFFKFVLPIFLLSYTASAAEHYLLNIEPIVAQQRATLDIMMNHLTRTQAAADSTGPNRISEVDVNKCFESYTSQEQAVVKTYNTNYNGCITTSDDAKAALSQQSSEQRKDILGRGNGVCSALSDCESIDDGLQFFQCYNAAAGANYPEVYQIYSDSDTIVEKLKVQYQTIDNNLTVCTTDARNNYVSGIATCNSDLSNCLKGAPPVTPKPTTVPSTLPTTVSTASTPSDLTTTEEITDSTPSDLTTTEEITDSTPSDLTTTEEITDETSETTPEETAPSTEASPEEDLWKYRPMSRMNMWNILKRA